MAKKKTHKTKKTHTRRRRRVGAISGENKTMLMQAAAGIGGAIMGAYIDSTVKKAAEANTSTSEYAKYLGAGAQIAAGYFVPKLIKQNSPMIKGLQMGLFINGGLSLVKALDILPGVGAVNVPMIGAADRFIDYRSQPVPMVGAAKMRENFNRNRQAAVLNN